MFSKKLLTIEMKFSTSVLLLNISFPGGVSESVKSNDQV